MNENPPQLGRPASPAAEWALDPTITYLNHGSFGACMRAILDVQQGWRTKLETHPTRFLARDLEDLLDWARSEFASFVGVDSDDLALVSNTTAAINTVLRSLHFDRGDEVLATDHAYNSCTNALRYVAAKDGAKVVLARIPFPLNHELAVAARDLLCEAMHTAVPAPPEMIGSMASIFLPGGPWSREDLASRMETIESALQGRRFEIPLMACPSPWLIDSGDLPPDTKFEVLLRISAQVYNYLGQYERLASILAGFAGANRTAAT